MAIPWVVCEQEPHHNQITVHQFLLQRWRHHWWKYTPSSLYALHELAVPDTTNTASELYIICEIWNGKLVRNSQL